MDEASAKSNLSAGMASAALTTSLSMGLNNAFSELAGAIGFAAADGVPGIPS
ncbi:MAG TPA: hypothetical protein VHZ09_16615 [Acidobacteriaceae bacterium]|jgi:hypothetical protein|nr:hypothetical protein [Acidobacteriaceae bacterium]